jgi:hypothetical protein
LITHSPTRTFSQLSESTSATSGNTRGRICQDRPNFNASNRLLATGVPPSFLNVTRRWCWLACEWATRASRMVTF